MLIIYTCITNDYDWLLPPLWQAKDVKYICFTDRKESVRGWICKSISSSLAGMESNEIARRYKIFPEKYLPKHDWSLWVDGNVIVLKNVSSIIKDLEKNLVFFASSKHPIRNNIWEERRVCIEKGKIKDYEISLINDQVQFYQDEGLTLESGLTENGVLFRKYGVESLRSAMELWWDQYQEFTKRDQISLPYVLYKKNICVYLLPSFKQGHNKFFKKVSHKTHGKLKLINYIDTHRLHNKICCYIHIVIEHLYQLKQSFKKT
jgi:hypothetical protein